MFIFQSKQLFLRGSVLQLILGYFGILFGKNRVYWYPITPLAETLHLDSLWRRGWREFQNGLLFVWMLKWRQKPWCSVQTFVPLLTSQFPFMQDGKLWSSILPVCGSKTSTAPLTLFLLKTTWRPILSVDRLISIDSMKRNLRCSFPSS